MKKWWKYKLSGTELCMKCRCTCGDRETLVSTTECLGLVRFNLSLTQSDTEQKQALTKQPASIHLSLFYISDSWQTFTHIKQEKKPSVLVVCGPGQVAQRAAGAERKTKQLPAAGTACDSWAKSVSYQPCILSLLLTPHCGKAVHFFLILWG